MTRRVLSQCSLHVDGNSTWTNPASRGVSFSIEISQKRSQTCARDIGYLIWNLNCTSSGSSSTQRTGDLAPVFLRLDFSFWLTKQTRGLPRDYRLPLSWTREFMVHAAAILREVKIAGGAGRDWRLYEVRCTFSCSCSATVHVSQCTG